MDILKKENLNIPNVLSFVRIIIIVPFVLYFLNDDYLASAFVLVVSGFSDMFDGMVARSLCQITPLGKVLDPLADKLTLTAVIICMGIKFPEIVPFVVILILKDLSMLISGSFLIKKGIEPPAARWYGKVATVFFYASVIIIVALKAIWGVNRPIVSISLLSITSVFMLFALFKYFIIFLKLINDIPASIQKEKD